MRIRMVILVLGQIVIPVASAATCLAVVNYYGPVAFICATAVVAYAMVKFVPRFHKWCDEK
jgi:hypothetical protein